MKSSEIFGLVVRCVGLFLVLAGLSKLYLGVIFMFQSFALESFNHILSGVLCLLLGLCVLRGTKQIVSFTYSEEPEKKE